MVNGFLLKKIEEYGVLKVTDKGRDFLKNPKSYMISIDKDFDNQEIRLNHKSQNDVIDEKLYKILIEERLKLSNKLNVPPFAIFQESSINEMTFKYPINFDELSMIAGVGEGKSKKFGESFISLISTYCKDNNINREQDFLVKSSGSKSGLKLFVIQSIDKKLTINEIAESKNLTYLEILNEIEAIVYSGTKLDLSYIIDDIFDEETKEELHEYLIETKSDNLQDLYDEFNDDFEDEDLRLFMLYFYCKVAF